MREATLTRKTGETEIEIVLNLNRKGESKISTGIGFFDHMLNLFAFQAEVALSVTANGDLNVDGHHTVEDVGIVLGQAVKNALGDKIGINRYGSAKIPMDDVLVETVLDISNRPYLVFNVELPVYKVGDFETELTEEFFRAFAVNAGITLHINVAYGKNAHHIIEGIFKSFGRALGEAIKISSDDIPSTKGVL
ncbi:MAG: imidazoleglycerol-phosphate dehydratase HisB [Endomicrobium sp.]|uniref:imidazoleglycerol-phosphate dehydratase HisB n=1 Tax=Candidatus Endomicrobiellum pyrsonymphae TaxID=1408203 RepID=UPI00357413EF|nr:imidazoleglycerol-phosphate dehydratase HisB [Endomicrobium sp.]